MLRRPALVSFVLIGSFAAACGHEPLGRLGYEELHSESEGRDLRYGVYLPPGWDRTTPLPLVVLLHGAGDDETSADREAVVGALDAAIEENRLPPFIMVTPEGERGFWINWHDGSHRYRDWVMDEVIPRVRSMFPTVPGPEGLHLVGVSMGGGGGLQIWLGDPSRFASATIVSAPILDAAQTRRFLRRFLPGRVMERVFGPEGSSSGIDPYVALDGPASLHGSRLLFATASRDIRGVRSSNHSFHQHLAEHEVPHTFVTFAGKHRWSAWGPLFVFALCQQLDPACALAVPEEWSLERVEGADSTSLTTSADDGS